MSKPNPRQDPLTQIILAAYRRGKAVLAAREKTARPSQVRDSKVIETKDRNEHTP